MEENFMAVEAGGDRDDVLIEQVKCIIHCIYSGVNKFFVILRVVLFNSQPVKWLRQPFWFVL